MAIAEDGDLILVRVAGSHFIWKMVRRMVGVLAAIGRGELAIAGVEGLLGGPTGPPLQTPTPAELTAPASGLFLERVFYEGDPRQMPLQPAIAVPSARG